MMVCGGVTNSWKVHNSKTEKVDHLICILERKWHANICIHTKTENVEHLILCKYTNTFLRTSSMHIFICIYLVCCRAGKMQRYRATTKLQ